MFRSKFTVRGVLAVLFLLAASGVLQAQYAINLVAGGGPNGLPALSSSIGFPGGMVKDPVTGNTYIADVDSSRILVVSGGATPTVSVYAGTGSGSAGEGGYAGDGGPARQAQLGRPDGLAVDSNGNLFIADTDNSVIREVTLSTGQISTVAGSYYPSTQACSYSGDSGPATSAQLCRPAGVFVDGAGNIFIADTDNSVVREVLASNGTIQTVAGNASKGAGYSGDSGPATSAQLKFPYSVFVDGTGNIYIADTENSAIRKVAQSSGNIETVAGSATLGAGYSGDGLIATSAQLDLPYDLFVDGAGDIFIADTGNSVIREVGAGQIIQTVAGNYTLGPGYSGDGNAATGAQLNSPNGVFVDGSGNIFLADSLNYVVREVDASSGLIQTLIGDNTIAYSGDGGTATKAALSTPGGVFVDGAGNIFIADTESSVIREVVAASGDIRTVAGNAALGIGYSGDGNPATSAQLNFPSGVFVDGPGDIFIADTGNSVVRCVVGTPGGCFGSTLSVGSITTVAGSTTAGYGGDGQPATQAELLSPNGVFGNSAGDLWIADTGNSVVRCVVGAAGGCFGSALGVGYITTIAGNGTECDLALEPCGDGAGATAAQLNFPAGVYGDSAGDLFIADTFDSKIREVTNAAGYVIETVAGGSTPGYSGDGAAATAGLLNTPYGLSVDSQGNIFIADTDNSVIREVVATTGFIQTIAGNGTELYAGDGGPATSAELFHPLAVAGDGAGDVFIADTENLRVRELVSTVSVTLSPTSATLPAGGSQQFAALVTGATDTSVTWQVNNVTGGNATVGTITSAGLYAAPATVPTPGTVTVAAVSNANGATSASAPVTIVPGSTTATVTVSTDPSVTVIYTGESQTLIATVTDSASSAVNWLVNGVAGGNSTVGTITDAGVYTAPSTVPSPATVLISAVLQSDASVSGSYPITIATNPAATAPPSQTLTAGGSATYAISLKANTGSPNEPITLSCLKSSLPLDATCTFSPTTITPGVSAVPFSLTINVATCSAALDKPSGSLLAVLVLPVFTFMFAGLGGRRFRKNWLVVLVLLCIPAMCVAGCGGGGTPTGSACTNPTGTYNVVVQGTTAAQPNPVTIVTVSLTVQ